jgi:apolipoprotein N-acyltransferase
MNVTAAIFFAFVPLFVIEQQNLKRLHYYILIYLALFIWNVTTTWWIWNASSRGAVMAIVLNSLLMCLPWIGFRYMKSKFGSGIGYLSLILFWLSFEYLHLQDWGLSWPWLTLGNVFASHTEWVQWYEYTGTSGGSLWILTVNVFLFSIVKEVQLNAKTSFTKSVTVSLIIALPILLSFIITNKTNLNKVNNRKEASVLIVQPNIDPYQKVTTGTFEEQLQKLIRLSEQAIDSTTSLLIWPETALYLPNGFDEINLKTNFFLNPLFSFLKRHPQLQLFTGIESYRLFNQRISSASRPIDGTSDFYEVYNGSVLLDSNGASQFYHKSMLVPGVETLPRFLVFLGPVFEKFGGPTNGYGWQEKRTPIITNKQLVLAPAICYESIYGEYMSRYIANGANLITVITNDGWWGNTPGYKQHQLYEKLRAIETRTFVARSANTGISCFIDPSGTVFEPQPWWTEAVIKKNIYISNQKTFFVRFGDVISKIALVMAAGLLLLALVKRFSKK